eukprot:2077701-Rhodomonas_salina.2
MSKVDAKVRGERTAGVEAAEVSLERLEGLPSTPAPRTPTSPSTHPHAIMPSPLASFKLVAVPSVLAIEIDAVTQRPRQLVHHQSDIMAAPTGRLCSSTDKHRSQVQRLGPWHLRLRLVQRALPCPQSSALDGPEAGLTCT